MRIILIGADGQLGSELVKIIISRDLLPLIEEDLDITNRDLTLKVIKEYSPDVVINTAAYNDVDGCENNELRAFEVNAQIFFHLYGIDLAKKVKELILAPREDPGGSYGLYHITNNGQCSWFEFARKIFELSRRKVNLKPITTEKFGARAKRPKYSVLKNHRLRQQGHDNLRPWLEAVRAYFKERSQ